MVWWQGEYGDKMSQGNMCLGDLNALRQEGHDLGKQYWDDLSGEELDPSMVMAARSEELKEFVKHNVYNKVPICKCWESTGKAPIGVRWVDVNKGGEIHLECRSRLVAK